MKPGFRRPGSWAAAACGAALSLGACSGGAAGDNTIAGQAQGAGDRQYISGDGRIETLTPDKRGEPITLSGTTVTGTPWSTSDHAGKVVVINVWGSWCPPCAAEMPELEKAWKGVQSAKKPVQFIGVDLHESAATGQAFLRREGVTYPSLADDGGASLIALQEKASTPPTTLVLDKQGRIAARIAGQTTASTLRGIIDDVLASA